MTSSDKKEVDFSAFVIETAMCEQKKCGKFLGDESVNVEELLCEYISFGEHGCDKKCSVCPNVTVGEDVVANDRRFSPREGINQTLRNELGCLNLTSTPIRAAWPIYTEKHSSVLGEQDKSPCNAVMFDVASGSGTVGGGELPKWKVTNASECVPESFETSGGFSSWRAASNQ